MDASLACEAKGWVRVCPFINQTGGNKREISSSLRPPIYGVNNEERQSRFTREGFYRRKIYSFVHEEAKRRSSLVEKENMVANGRTLLPLSASSPPSSPCTTAKTTTTATTTTATITMHHHYVRLNDLN